jgi:hypothetical protein
MGFGGVQRKRHQRGLRLVVGVDRKGLGVLHISFESIRLGQLTHGGDWCCVERGCDAWMYCTWEE